MNRRAHRRFPLLASTSSSFMGTSLIGLQSGVLLLLILIAASGRQACAQDDSLDKVHIDSPLPKPKPADTPAPLEGKDAMSARPNERIRVDVNLVLIPVTVTDPLNRAGYRSRSRKTSSSTRAILCRR